MEKTLDKQLSFHYVFSKTRKSLFISPKLEVPAWSFHISSKYFYEENDQEESEKAYSEFLFSQSGFKNLDRKKDRTDVL